MNIRSRQEHSYTGYSSHSLWYTFTVRHHGDYDCADGHFGCVSTVITDTDVAAYSVSDTTKSTFRAIPIDLRSKSHTHKYHYVSSLSPSFSTYYNLIIYSCLVHSNCVQRPLSAHFAQTGLTVGLAERSTSFTPSPPLNMRSKILHNHGLSNTSFSFYLTNAQTINPLTCASGHSNCAFNPYSYEVRYIVWSNPASSSNYE